MGVSVKVSNVRSRSTLFSPKTNRTGVIKIIILALPEGRALGRFRERGTDGPPVYKPPVAGVEHHTTTRPP